MALTEFMQNHKNLKSRLTASLLRNEDFWSYHQRLAEFNKSRLKAGPQEVHWEHNIEKELNLKLLEERVLQEEIKEVSEELSQVPQSPAAFMQWFEDLKENGPGQQTSFFDWLENEATREQVVWFVKQEVAGEAGFDDLAALTQIGLPTRAKLEVARNYWDEMGRGTEKGMHGPMLERLATELGLTEIQHKDVVIESLALGNVMLGFAINPRYRYHSVGSLGAVELTAPGRAEKVYKALARHGVSKEGQKYFKLHSTVDIKHSEAWNAEVIAPLVESDPALCRPIAAGALVRLNAGARCFKRYQKELSSQVLH